MNDTPLAYFITWTVYGTHLQGAINGWRRRGNGTQLPQPRLEAWRRDKLKHDVILLTPELRLTVEAACREHCQYRGWHLWVINARSNHVHVVTTTREYSGDRVRDQIKANCTREIRKFCQVLSERPVWTELGDWICINSEDELDTICSYVAEAQDRKGQEY